MDPKTRPVPPAPENANPEEPLPPEVLALIRQGDEHKIAAIKKLRDLRPGLGLADAKRIVEEAGIRLGTMSRSPSACFIASACHTDPDHPALAELRLFRDDRLQRTRTGRALVARYYRWAPTPAAWIRRSAWRAGLVRWLLVQPCAAVARALRHLR